ncbi:MAG: hypothetical protein ACK4FF_05540 [Limnobacter sp.]|uniref:hypothetical protein n=1 Tax=Limnobacter sp. TaxID=2003368 RepID=UPI00391BFEED
MTDVKSRLPASYKPAEWRCTMPFDAASGRVGIGFNLQEGQTVRLALSVQAIRDVIETLQPYLHLCHSDISSEIPSSDVSCPPLSENV